MLLPEFQVCKGLHACKPEIPNVCGIINILYIFDWSIKREHLKNKP